MRERAVAEPKRSGMNVPCPPRAETSRCCGRTDRRVGPLGRHKVAPELSPSKTVEGFLGGVATASLLGALLWWITPFSPLQAGAVALMINLMGFFGGLVMSAIKRDRGVKDWGIRYFWSV